MVKRLYRNLPKEITTTLVFFLVSIIAPQNSRAETISLPMTFDFQLLRSLIVSQAYQDPDESAAIVTMNQGCNDIRLNKPQIQEEEGLVRFQTDIRITWGTPIGGNCFAPLYWSGSAVFLQQPIVDKQWQLHFNTQDSTLLDSTGNRAPLSGLVWDLIKNNVHSYINAIVLNLAPPVDNLKQFIAPQAPNQLLDAAGRFLADMHPDTPQVRSDSLSINILAEADIPESRPEKSDVPPIEKPEQQEQLMNLWQTWDALLVHMINRISSRGLSPNDRRLLLDTLLRVRYEFTEVIGTPALTTAFVRHQFIASWQDLKPLFRNHLSSRPADNPLGYLSFFTAADALVVLDRIGPLIGIDISREGFYRLAHMLSADETLNEGGAVDRRLRDALGLEPDLPLLPAEKQAPSLQERIPAKKNSQKSPADKIEVQPGKDPLSFLLDQLFPWLSRLSWQDLFSPVEAHAAAQPSFQEVRSWTAELMPSDSFLPRVHKILNKAVHSLNAGLAKETKTPAWEEKMIHATAWQESCFRQFVVKDKKITYLLSYNNTSVGIMQINEKVWRGIYDLQGLRWNIEYNSVAGAEILTLYLNRYISRKQNLKKISSEAGKRYLAAWLYALYNGGPSQLDKFPQRNTNGSLYKSEQLFLEKYDKIEGQHWLALVDCLPSR
ncbi:MAG: lytic transglycosylase domain-containing protein [Desulfopila sp.]|jgi:hypothetical protein|nr:lytic transglycosylase domain-containing protein [Desulfopila sp.]